MWPELKLMAPEGCALALLPPLTRPPSLPAWRYTFPDNLLARPEVQKVTSDTTQERKTPSSEGAEWACL